MKYGMLHELLEYQQNMYSSIYSHIRPCIEARKVIMANDIAVDAKVAEHIVWNNKANADDMLDNNKCNNNTHKFECIIEAEATKVQKHKFDT